jgi:hypothetical protein
MSGFARRIAAATLALLALGGAALAQGERVALPGTGISLVPPQGFVQPEEFIGLLDPEAGTSIIVTVAEPAAYEELLPVFTSVEDAAEFFSGQGLQIDATFSVSSPDGTIPYLRGTQEANGVTVGKWIGLAGGAQAVLLTANVPPSAELTQAEFEALLASLEIAGPATLEEQVAALPFRVEAAEPFVFAQVMDGSMVALIDASVAEGEPQPAIILDARFNITGMPPLADAAEDLLRSISDFAEIEINESAATSFAGGEAWLLSGVAEDPALGTVRVRQWLGHRDGDLLRMVAYGPIEGFEEISGAVDTIAASVQWK